MEFYRKNGGSYSESTIKRNFENKKWREILFDEFNIYQVKKVIVIEKEVKTKQKSNYSMKSN